MSANQQLVREFCQAWSCLDPAELASYFTEDGVYHNMPAGPIAGRTAVEEFIHGFTAPCQRTMNGTR